MGDKEMLYGIGISEEDLELKTFNFTEYTTIHKDDLQLIQDTMAFSSNYIGKQDNFIKTLLRTIDSITVPETDEVWVSVKDQLMDEYLELQEVGTRGVEMINKQTEQGRR